jgi:formate dehydrogenase
MAAVHEFKPKILGFLCNWCSYAGADLCGVSRYQFPASIRVIRLMCSGRVDLEFVLRAFANGIDGVFVGGCWLGECHYVTEGNYDALSMMHLGKKLLEYTGLNPDRLRLEGISASQGLRYAEVVTDFTARLKELGPLGTGEGVDQNALKLKLEAIRKLLPYIKLVEREKLRVRFESKAEYEEFFASDELISLFNELIVDKLASSQLLQRQALCTGEIANGPGTSASEVSSRSHPGSRRRGGRDLPKGRQVEAQALAEVCGLLADRPRRRDLLIEFLHLLQDSYGCLHARHLAALAQELGLALVEVYEVASFYAHFDIVLDGEPAPPLLTVRVCDSLGCEMFGAQQLLRDLPARLGPGVRVVRAPCMGGCHNAPVAAVGRALHEHATLDSIAAAVAKGDVHPHLPQYRAFDSYRADGGYRLLEACRTGTKPLDAVLKALEDAQLRGLGGAGFPTGRKWRLVRAQPKPRLMAVNADEGEPGTFKDRTYLETDPHRFLEGMLIAAEAIEADEIYIYLRDEYPQIRELLLVEIAKLDAAGLVCRGRIHLRRGAGAYICGEESAMLESIEGKRGLPRHKPPYPAEVGLFGRPTLINNVETLYWVRDIVERGPDWFAGQGRRGRKGPRSFSVSGRVKEPGVKLAPAGITARELIDEHCGGMLEGHVFKAYLPGGASGGILPAAMADLPLDFGTLQPHGCLIGSAAVIVLSDKDDMKEVVLNLLRFFADESCGQCTPCHVGTEKAVELLQAPQWDGPLLDELGLVMTASICGLGQAAMNPVRMVLEHFPEEVS